VTIRELAERDRNEIQRSAEEAAQTALTPVDVERYLNPPADTAYALEYSYYLLGDVQGKTVLDLGCGSGENLIPLVKRGANVIGMDISPELIELSGRRLSNYGLHATLEARSAYETALPNESIDVVFCIALLHHLDLPLVTTEIHRILRLGGILILQEPIRFSRTMGYLRRFFPTRSNISDYEHPMTRGEVAIVSARFEVVAERNFRIPFVPLLNMFRIEMKAMWALDRWLLRGFPALERFATVKVMALRK
jgi:SAM-dependent methyltransferase